MKKKIFIKKFENLFIFMIFFLLLLAFWNTSYAYPDSEEEIFIKGQQIAQGLYLYKDIACQHMPVIYFISAFFSMCGVASITGFRICFYLILALNWTIVYAFYKKNFGRVVLVGYVLVYLGIIVSMRGGTSILCEHFQGQGMVILFLALLKFSEKMEINWKDSVMISAAIFLSFGNAFVSAFAIFFIAITVLALEIRKCLNEKRNFGSFIVYFIQKYYRMILIAMVPWIVLLIYFKMTGTLYSFYSWAYALNRKVYPKYTMGYGGGILGGFLGGISSIGTSVNETSAITFQTIRAFALVLCALLYLIKSYRDKKNAVLTIGSALFLVGTLSRGGTDNIHGLPACAVMSVLAALFLQDICKKLPKTQKQEVINLACAILYFSGYIALVGNIFGVTTQRIAVPTTDAYYQRKLEDVIDSITEDGERVGCAILNYDILMNAHVTPASVTGGSCPWLWEWGGDQAMQELKENPPRVFLFNPDQETWGYPIRDYAWQLCNFIQKKYVRMDSIAGLSRLYIRKDIYADVYPVIDNTCIYKTYDIEVAPIALDSTECVKQTFVATKDATLGSVNVIIGTYGRNNNWTLNVELVDETENKVVIENSINCSELGDGVYASVLEGEVQIIANHRYSIVLSSEDATESEYIALFSDGGYATEQSYVIIDGERQDYNIAVKLLAK